MTKYLTVPLPPDKFSWVIRRALVLKMDPGSYVEELIDAARAADGMAGEIRRKDGDPRNLEMSNLEVTSGEQQ